MSPDGPIPVPPEEKLLRLIRGAPQSPPHATRIPPSAHGPAGLTGRVRLGWQAPSWGLAAINISLGGLLIAELVALALVVTKPAPGISVTMPHQPAAASPAVEFSSADASVPQLAATVSRPFFQATDTPEPPSQKEAQRQTAQASALAARLSLIGVVAGEPAQAIIEDAQTKKTYFVTVGQGLIEGLVVEEIRENRAVLDLNGETIELSL